ncbi:hypothetical protein B6087_01550 [Campylobacter jejuni]|uniref:hypothetical protein n=1 Tax=Campylobacter jejuni TaxID=197 RepID=UPI0008F4FBB5|nr:hypothetical protein [Campylobacter jejuni]EIX0252217.1 hypothetical protein [Campylobacter coli]APA51076.1 hypothetical protein BLD34_06540 [Campylobacter jejuni]EAH9663505.1 hypothetical protein [Campylobacter jejuni]EAI5582721.1 hypothetical protein [Campylobacter jejuni]EAI5648522.1 hypothetical protein [Campylobacter jejuni]
MIEARSILDVLSFRKTEEKEELRKCFNFNDEVFEKGLNFLHTNDEISIEAVSDGLFEKTIISIKVSK